ncbi:MAG: UDP-glucose 4-epimerase [Pelagibacteraceae bacterium TMED65]|nr:MAG: UDP-glucose 4-epimerase [Pelagibacteraceae bacterium TMED65]|tara:strand:- start:847 stop:1827 length:981 start_codon:yes stop_codon:yes gene_type:complete
MREKILIVGGAGYVGSMLAKKLLNDGYKVRIFDLFIYDIQFQKNEDLELVKGDIRNISLLEKSLKEIDHVIHLACISNDPSFELNPDLGKSINFDSFEPFVKLCTRGKIKRFIYASSSSVYGLSKEKNVNEEHVLKPLTDYSKFKVGCEEILTRYKNSDMIWTILRPATVCGYSIRQRFDVVVNLLTNLAFNKEEISVFGGDQLRPNVNINDMIDSYITVLKADYKKIKYETFNVGYENLKVLEIAKLVRKTIGKKISLKILPTDDNRSYHISSNKIGDVLNFKMKHTVEDAIKELVKAFEDNLYTDPLANENYFNIKKMQNINLK